MAPSDPTDQMYLAYAGWVKEVYGSGLQSSQLHIAPLSFGVIPRANKTNEMYQNWCIYNFCDTVPRDDEPSLNSSGLGYVTAYTTYLANVDLTKGVQLQNPDAIKEAQSDLADREAQVSKAIKDARASFISDCPNGIDPLSGNPITFTQYLQKFHPEAQTLQDAVDAANARLGELLDEEESKGIIAQIKDWRANLAKGTSQTSASGWNMSVITSDPGTISQVTTGQIPPNTTQTSLEPHYDLAGGDFDNVTGQWVDTFPPDYPSPPGRQQYLAKCQTATIDFEAFSQSSWTDHGYSTSTTYNGTSGWIFWSHVDVSTNTETHTDSKITGSDLQSKITVRWWGSKTIGIEYGRWRLGNPSDTFPTLYQNADSSVKKNVSEFYDQVIVAYGVEIEFQLSQSAFTSLQTFAQQTSSNNDSLSIFGSIYTTGDSSSSVHTTTFGNLDFSAGNNTVRMLAVNDGVPLILGAVATVVKSAH